MEVPPDPRYFVGYLSLTDELNWVAPASPAAPAGAAAPVSRPVVQSFRKKPRKQTMRSAKEQEAYLNRAFDKRQADRKKLEKEASRVAKQQAAAAAVDSQNWHQIHKEAAVARHDRQQAVAERQAARAHMAEAAQATRAISKAVAVKKAAVEAPVVQAEQQGPAPLPCLATAQKAAGQRGRISGGRQKRVALMKKPTKKVGRAQGSSTGRKRPLAANRFTLAKQYCRCCFTRNAPTWRTGHVQPFTGQQLCNACSIWEGRHGSLAGSHDKGCMMQHIGASDSDSTQSRTPEAAAAPVAAVPAAAAPAAAAAAARPDAVQHQKCSKRQMTQHVQQADIPAGDAGSGTPEAGPQVKRKRSAADSNMQQVQPKRARANCRGRHGAEVNEASTSGQGMVPVAPVARQQRALRARKPMA